MIVEFLLKFNSNNGFQLFLDVLLNLKKIARIELAIEIEVVHARASFFQLFQLFKVKKSSMSFVLSSQDFNYPFSSRFSSKTLAKRKNVATS